MPVRFMAAVRILRWVRRAPPPGGLAKRLAAAAASEEPGPLLELRRQQVASTSTAATEKRSGDQVGKSRPAPRTIPAEQGHSANAASPTKRHR